MTGNGNNRSVKGANFRLPAQCRTLARRVAVSSAKSCRERDLMVRGTLRSTESSHQNGSVKGASLSGIIEAQRAALDTVQEVVIASLRQAILQGVLSPGTRLRQEELGVIFHTSRIPVREALRLLEHEGLVASRPHRGFVVRPIGADEIEEIYDLRTVLECHAVRLVTPLLTEDDLLDLDRLFEVMEAAEEPEERRVAREELYLRLYSITARPRLIALIVRLRQDLSRSLRWSRIYHSAEHHRAFFGAVKRGDADAAVDLLTAHYRRVGALLRRFIREAEVEGQLPTPH